MEGKGRSRKKTVRATIKNRIKAWMSMALTAAVLAGNMASSVGTILAAPAPKEEFRVHAAAIQDAAEKALEKGTVVTEEILIGGKDKSVVKEYEKMFAADGKLYELDLSNDVEAVNDADGIELRVFLRLPEEADPKTYALNGEEELYFVYVNYGEESAAARLNIDGLVSGFSTVRAYDAVFGEKEKAEAVVSGGSQTGGTKDEAVEESEAAEDESQDQESLEEPEAEMPDDEKAEESSDKDNSIDNEEADNVNSADESDSSDTADADETADKAEAETKVEEGSAHDEDNADKETADAPSADKPEKSEKPAPEESAEASDEGQDEPDQAVKESDKDAEKPAEENKDEKPAEEEKSVEKESVKEEKTEDKSEDRKSDEKEDVQPDKDKPDSAKSDVEKSDKDDSEKEVTVSRLEISLNQVLRVAAPEEDAEPEIEEKEEAEEKEEIEAEISDEETEDEAKAEDIDDEQADSDYGNEDGDPFDKEDAAEDLFKTKGTLKGKMYNLVSFEDGLTARAFATTFANLGIEEEDLTEGGHILTYTVSPAGSAVVINASELVRDEAEVVFGVMPQVGYRISAVTANGEELEYAGEELLASSSDAQKALNSDSEKQDDAEYNEDEIRYFIIPKVLEDQEVEILLNEEVEGSHPAFNQSKTMSDGVTITVSAEEGILPEGTYLTVKEVTDKVAEAVKENFEKEQDTVVSGILAYDINLMLDGKKLSNAYWHNDYVTVEFSGARIKELKQNGSIIEVAPLETPIEVVEAAMGKSEEMPLLENITAEDVRINKEEVTVIPEDEEDSIQVRAEHFTVYVIVSNNKQTVNQTAVAYLYYENDNGNIEINGTNYIECGESNVSFNNNGEILPGNIDLSLDGNSIQATAVYYKKGNVFNEIDSFQISRQGQLLWYTYTITATYDNNNQKVTFASSNTNNSGDFYWIVNKPEGHRVEWYVNGELNAVSYVKDGEKPTYLKGTPSRSDNEYARFAGWAKEANSKFYSSEDDLPEVTEDTKYYAIFTYDALFYFVLEGHSNTSGDPEDYMFAGPDKKNNQQLYGKVIVPDEFKNGLRWYTNGSQIDDMNNLIIEGPEDPDIRKGIKTVYQNYSEDWEYRIDWTTLSYANYSVSYNRQEQISNRIVLHVDGAVILERKEEIGLQYHVVWPNGETITNSVTHSKNEIQAGIAINSTIKIGEPTYITDAYEYDAKIVHEGEDYYFDGWYLNLDCTEKAGDTYNTLKIQTFYARYSKMDKLTYDPNGGDGKSYSESAIPFSTLTVKGNTFKREGYVFKGWNTKADGTGTPYTEGDRYNLTSEADILYAQWERLTGSFNIKKILVDGVNFTNAHVDNVTFQLYETNDETGEKKDEVYWEVKMSGEEHLEDNKDKFGVFKFSNIPTGYYYLHEETTAPGYKLLDEDIKIEICVDNNGEVQCYYYDGENKKEIVKDGLEVKNNPVYIAILPDTGGPGLGLIKEFGWFLLLLAMMMAGMEVQYCGNRRRKVRMEE